MQQASVVSNDGTICQQESISGGGSTDINWEGYSVKVPEKQLHHPQRPETLVVPDLLRMNQYKSPSRAKDEETGIDYSVRYILDQHQEATKNREVRDSKDGVRSIKNDERNHQKADEHCKMNARSKEPDKKYSSEQQISKQDQTLRIKDFLSMSDSEIHQVGENTYSPVINSSKLSTSNDDSINSPDVKETKTSTLVHPLPLYPSLRALYYGQKTSPKNPMEQSDYSICPNQEIFKFPDVSQYRLTLAEKILEEAYDTEATLIAKESEILTKPALSGIAESHSIPNTVYNPTVYPRDIKLLLPNGERRKEVNQTERDRRDTTIDSDNSTYKLMNRMNLEISTDHSNETKELQNGIIRQNEYPYLQLNRNHLDAPENEQGTSPMLNESKAKTVSHFQSNELQNITMFDHYSNNLATGPFNNNDINDQHNFYNSLNTNMVSSLPLDTNFAKSSSEITTSPFCPLTSGVTREENIKTVRVSDTETFPNSAGEQIRQQAYSNLERQNETLSTNDSIIRNDVSNLPGGLVDYPVSSADIHGNMYTVFQNQTLQHLDAQNSTFQHQRQQSFIEKFECPRAGETQHSGHLDHRSIKPKSKNKPAIGEYC